MPKTRPHRGPGLIVQAQYPDGTWKRLGEAWSTLRARELAWEAETLHGARIVVKQRASGTVVWDTAQADPDHEPDRRNIPE